MTEQLHFETFEEFVEDTRRFYYEDDWTPKLTRATNGEGGCEYKTSDGRCCAVGRIDPNTVWEPRRLSCSPHNLEIARFAMAKIVSRKPKGDVHLMLASLQDMHDCGGQPYVYYHDALTLARELDKDADA